MNDKVDGRSKEARAAKRDTIHSDSLASEENQRMVRDAEHDVDHDMSGRNKINNLEIDAISMDKRKRMDCSYYQNKYQDMQFMWINDMDGDVQKWLQAGAEPQAHEEAQFSRQFEGLTDKSDNWVSVVAGTDGGNPFKAYLLKMSREDYLRVRINPTKKHNQEIQEAMGLAARAGEASADARGGSNLETYAANTVTGDKGFAQIGGEGGFNSITGR